MVIDLKTKSRQWYTLFVFSRLAMWIEKDDKLFGTFEFNDFVQAFAFMTQVALIAEKMNHHPDWSNIYNKVEIRLSTHDAGNIVTTVDREMAAIIESLYNR